MRVSEFVWTMLAGIVQIDVGVPLLPLAHLGCRLGFQDLISHKVFIKSLYKIQLPYKSVNLSFTSSR